MKQSENFRTNLIRYISTALTVSLLVTLKVETPCSVPSSAAGGDNLTLTVASRTS